MLGWERYFTEFLPTMWKVRDVKKARRGTGVRNIIFLCVLSHNGSCASVSCCCWEQNLMLGTSYHSHVTRSCHPWYPLLLVLTAGQRFPPLLFSSLDFTARRVVVTMWQFWLASVLMKRTSVWNQVLNLRSCCPVTMASCFEGFGWGSTASLLAHCFNTLQYS